MHLNILIPQRRWLATIAEECDVTESAVVRTALALLQDTEKVEGTSKAARIVFDAWSGLRVREHSPEPNPAPTNRRPDRSDSRKQPRKK